MLRRIPSVTLCWGLNREASATLARSRRCNRGRGLPIHCPILGGKGQAKDDPKARRPADGHTLNPHADWGFAEILSHPVVTGA